MIRREAALELAARGFKVFPIKPGAKSPPLIQNWPENATDDRAVVDSLWARWPDANIGIHCEDMIVLDVDAKKGGNESFDFIGATYGFPETLCTHTPSDGKHLFYRFPGGVSNSVERVADGIDVRSNNGYVVSPGSSVPAGHYRFDSDVPIADAPDWLIQKLVAAPAREKHQDVEVPDAPEDVMARAEEWLKLQQPAIEGQGGDAHTFAVACGLRDMGASAEQAIVLLAGEWNERCAPPWDADDLVTKVRNAYKYAANEPGLKAVKADDFPVVEQAAPVVADKTRYRPQRFIELVTRAAAGPGYLIKGLLQRASQAVMYGAPGEGKTFVALDMAYHIASGKDWMGRRVRKGLVLYLAYEGVGGIARRAMALHQKHGDSDVPLYVHAADYNLRELAGRQALTCVLKELPEKPTLVVIDTLARAMKGGDENSAQDMGALMDAVGALVAATGACVLLVHHSGKNKAGGARGSSALLGAIDTETEVDERQVKSTKQRDLELSAPIGFDLIPLVVGVDEDGDEITSCAVVPARPRRITGKIGGDVKRAFEVLCDLRPSNEPITQGEWLAACAEFGLKHKRMYDIVKSLTRANFIVAGDNGTITRVIE